VLGGRIRAVPAAAAQRESRRRHRGCNSATSCRSVSAIATARSVERRARARSRIAGDGRRLVFARAEMGARSRSRRARSSATYVVEVTAGAQPGDAVNTAIGAADGGRSTNRAEGIGAREGAVLRQLRGAGGPRRGGRVHHSAGGARRSRNVRLLLDDGTYTNTDGTVSSTSRRSATARTWCSSTSRACRPTPR
jgi:hypothetical protein